MRVGQRRLHGCCVKLDKINNQCRMDAVHKQQQLIVNNAKQRAKGVENSTPNAINFDFAKYMPVTALASSIDAEELIIYSIP